MKQCYKTGDFKQYFNENMSDLGLIVPNTMFDTQSKAIDLSVKMVASIALLGKQATITEILLATNATEKLFVLAGMYAFYYVGGAIGGIAVASGRVLGCGSRIADMFLFLNENKLIFDGWHTFYFHHPEIFNKTDKHRNRFALNAKVIKND